MPGRLEGRRVVIAGAGAGAGRALAYVATQEGARVVIGARTKTRIDETAALVAKSGGTITAHVVDLTSSKDVARFFDRAAKDLGGAFDVLFCLAGGWHAGSLETSTDEEVETSLSQYVKSALLVNRGAIPHLLRGKDPAIVNFSAAVGGSGSARGSTLYNVSKAAVAELTRSLAADLLEKGIRVNAVNPGSISHRYEIAREYRALRRLGKAPGTAEDVAHAAVFLASHEASWITGATLPVDGGWLVNRAP